MRISGPYRHRAGWRFRVSEGPGVYAWAPSASTVDEARELADAYAQGLQARHALTIAGLAERYAQHLRDAIEKAGFKDGEILGWSVTGWGAEKRSAYCAGPKLLSALQGRHLSQTAAESRV